MRFSLLLSILSCAVLLTPVVSLADIVDRANALRTEGCGGKPALDSPLARSPLLDEAAQRVANGTELQQAATSSGYRARRVARIRLVNADGDDATDLLEQNFCGILSDPELVDIGMHRASRETWLVLAAPLALDAGLGAASAADRLHTGINDARAAARRCGFGRKLAPAPAMRRSSRLDAAAAVHARDIAARGALGHDGADGSSPADRVARAGYAWTTVGENVAAGQTNPEDVVDTWLDSPGHCRNLMNERFTETGIAVAINQDDDKVIYWVQVYAAPE